MRHTIFGSILPVLPMALGSSQPSFEQFCTSGLEGYAKATNHGKFAITNVTYIPTGAISLSNLSPTNLTNTAAFCRVFASVPYPKDNQVSFELWLPDKVNYNDRFLSVGNGGFSSIIDEISLTNAVNSGYACAGGNTGHLDSDNNGGSGAPGVYLPFLHDKEQVEAWIHNSIAMFTSAAKEIVEKVYGCAPKYSYYQGCSTGGAQGFALAQFHPTLFDGIVAGSPGNWYSHLALSFLWNSVDNTSTSYLPQESLDLITQHVLDKCDTLDGVKDGVIENPLICDYDISNLQCKNSHSTNCLTKQQIAQVKKIYQGPKNSHTGASLYPGFSVGSEKAWIQQESVLADAFAIPILQNRVFNNLSYDATTFDWNHDVKALDETVGILIDEITPNLSAFKAHGAKMVVTQAWADPYNAALWPIKHREQLQEAMSGNIDDWFGLFMVPGGGHCGSNPAYPQVPGTWHSLDTLVSWVEHGQKPTQMLSTQPADGTNRTRKLCRWPMVAHYKGGNPDDWTSYSCQ
ncbi:tannase and feruloyl esterase [Trichoderma sp. SZMC 28011]